MNKEQKIEAIVKANELYFRSFALVDGIFHHEGDIEWIAPLLGTSGPALVFKVSLSDTAGELIERLIPDIQSGKIPSCWVLSPLSNSKISDILLSSGFTGGLGSGEYGMAMDMNTLANLPAPSNIVEVKKVTSIADFKVWIDVVNTALHGWDMLSIEQYSVWLNREEFAFYLGYIDGVPISTAATMQDSKCAGVEFVSTQKEYRHKGAAYAVCHKALFDLQSNNVETVTLVSLPGADKLYEKLGFKPYYEQLLFLYQNTR